jgi:glyoxylase-like metal-dependent hydrolase (beta-lactamase superfamily II)
MAEVKILIQGYTTADTVESEEEKTCPTITLVKDKDIVMVVDPGVLESQQMFIDKLKQEGLSVDDINIVCITHSHIDHYRNIGMFPKAKTLEYFGLWDKNTVEDWKEQFTEDIRIIKTPGHNYDNITLLVKTDKGIIAICGDVFWKENYPKEDPYASDNKKLRESREKILKMADWIIPGHAGIYKVKK